MTNRLLEEVETQVSSLVRTAFDELPCRRQPGFVAHVGCADGSLLKRLYELVRSGTRRGESLTEHPLTLIAIDGDPGNLELAQQTLHGIPSLFLQEAAGRGNHVVDRIRSSGIADLEKVLYIRTFTDHRACQDGNREALEVLKEWAAVPTDHGFIVSEAHRLEPEIMAKYADRLGRRYVEGMDCFSHPGLLTADEYLAIAGEAGLFVKPDAFKKYPAQLPVSRVTVNHFEKRAYSVRPARKEDMPRLLELEVACWEEGLRFSSQVLGKRLEIFPRGNVVLEWKGSVVGVVYWQRITESDALMGSQDDEVHSLHDPTGRVAHLVRLNMLPEAQPLGLGDQLLEVMLQRLHMSNDVDSVVAVTLCKDFPEHSAMSLEEYVRHEKEPGKLTDPILNFHYRHGAEIRGLVPGYRPEDSKNLGHGVLAVYDIRNRRTSGRPDSRRTGPSTPARIDAGAVEKLLQELIRGILGSRYLGTFSSHVGLMEMGLDSLDLTELRALIERSFGVTVGPTFFFTHRNVDEICSYLLESRQSRPEAVEEPRRGAPADETRRPATAPSRIEAAYKDDDVAVIGVACRLPGGVTTLEHLRTLLENRQDAIRGVPAWRWPDHVDLEALGDGVRRGGFVDDAASFDAAFFRISPREAEWMDPQQRWMLELSWEVIEDAVRDFLAMRNSKTGVFVGACHYDYRDLLRDDAVEAHFSTGNSPSIIANRISYFYDFRGPSLTIDTACSSSLVAVHEAVKAICNGDCEEALAGGVNVIASPRYSLSYNKAGMLATDGRCKTFDQSADGYVRGEGAALLLLKPLARAVEDRDRIYAVIKGSAVNHGGAAASLTAPNPAAQAELLATAYRAAGVAPQHVGYVEAHGTGTALGDPIEVEGLRRGFAAAGEGLGSGGCETASCALGSVKTNIGHLESAAGIAGVLKILTMLRTGRIPGAVNFETLNPEIDLAGSPFYIAEETREWRRSTDEAGETLPYRAGVSSFGFGGANAHVVLEEYPQKYAEDDSRQTPPPLHLLTLSAPDEDSLRRVVQRYEGYFRRADATAFGDVCHTAYSGRHHFDHRLAVIAAGKEDCRKLLEGYLEEVRPAARIVTGKSSRSSPPVAFMFTGQGAQYAEMGKQLYESHPVFKQHMDRCAEGLKQEMDKPLLSLLWGEDTHFLGETQYTQPALFALEVSLAEVWQACGIEPAVVLGHSIGEYSAACVAGVFRLEDGLELVAARGRLMAERCERGDMVSVAASVGEVVPLVARFPGLAIAADNSPRQVVVSGDEESVSRFQEAAAAADLRTRKLKVSHAFHSSLMEPMLEEFGAVAEGIEYHEPRISLVSNVTGTSLEHGDVNAQYWVQHVKETVQLRAGMKLLQAQGCEILIEVGPKPVLISFAKRCLDVENHVFLPTLTAGGMDWETLLSSVGECHVRGCAVDWSGVDPGGRRRRVGLPTYPFAKDRFWPSQERSRDHTPPRETPSLLGNRLVLAGTDGDGGDVYFEKRLEAEQLSFLADHRLGGEVVMPAAGYVELALLAARELHAGGKRELDGLMFYRPLLLGHGASIQTKVKSLRGSGGRAVEIWAGGSATPGDGWTLLASGVLSDGRASLAEEDVPEIDVGDAEVVTRSDLYSWFHARGYEYGARFQAVEKLWVKENAAVSEVSLRSAPGDGVLPPVLLDASFQTAIALLRGVMDEQGALFVPSAIGSVAVETRIPDELRVAVRRLTASAERSAAEESFDVFLQTPEGSLVAAVRGLRLSRFDLRTLDADRSFFYRPTWSRRALRDESGDEAGKVLIFSSAAAEPLARRLAEHHGGGRVVEVVVGEESRRVSADRWHVRPGDSATIDAVVEAHRDLDRIYYLGGFFLPEESVGLDFAGLERLQEQGLMSLFHLIKSMDRHGHCDRGVDVKVVTHGTNPVTPHDVTVPWGGGLTGLSNVLASEYGNVNTVNLDVDWQPGSETAGAVRAILDEPARSRGAMVALRGGDRYRLANDPVLLPECPANDAPFRERGAYLILGGAGGIGMVLSRHLAQRFQARLCLVGRSPLSERKRGELRELELLGSEVSYHQADGSDPVAMKRVVAQALRSYGELHGVVHSALQLEDRLLANMSEDEFRAALAPKVQASWALYEATRGCSLDFMLFFSSCLAFYGHQGQANYIAGCTFKDAFAAYLRSHLGIPAKVVNWGYWGDVGAVSSEEFARYMEGEGFESISSEEGIEAIERILGSPAAQIMAVKANDQALRKMLVTSRDRRRWIADVVPVDLEELSRDVSVPVSAVGRDRLVESYEALNRWSTRMLLRAFRDLGVTPDGEYDRATLRRDLQVAEEHGPLLAASLAALESAGFVRGDGAALRFVEVEEAEDLEKEGRRLRETYPWIEGAIELAGECGRHFADVVRGRRAATEVIFPESSMKLVEGFYRRDALAHHCNRLAAGTCLAFAKALKGVLDGGRKIRMIEIGAGTGGTTQEVLKALEPLGGGVEYVYSDLSIAFLEHGRRELGTRYPYVSYEVLDVEKAPQEQGFELGTFDLVLATNVIHATRDVGRSLRHLKSLMKKGAVLVLNELNRRQELLTLTFGLLTGWWLAEDEEKRLPHGPLLSVDLWRKALEEEGFHSVTVLDAPVGEEEAARLQNVIVAQSDGYVVSAPATARAVEDMADPPWTEVETGEEKSPEEIVAGSQEAAAAYLRAYLRRTVSRVLRLAPERLDRPGQPFHEVLLGELGFDSLLYMELRNQIRQDLSVDVSVESFIGNDVGKIVNVIYDQLLLHSLNMGLESEEAREGSDEEDMEAFVL